MWQYTTDVTSFFELAQIISSLKARTEVSGARSLLFQIFSSTPDPDLFDECRRVIGTQYPGVPVIGASSSGEIANGRIFDRSTTLTLMSFESSDVFIEAFDCSEGTTTEQGWRLRDLVMAHPDAQAVEILCTSKGMNDHDFVSPLASLPDGVCVFGGGADTYESDEDTIVIANDRNLSHGAVAAIFCGEDLHVAVDGGRGWKPLGRLMSVTETRDSNMTIVSAEGEPATEVYRKCLGIENDEHFHDNAEEFPLIVRRGDGHAVRVPVSSERDGSIRLGADIAKGEQFQLGYGDPSDLVEASLETAREMRAFGPQAMLAFCCITRKSFLKEYAGWDARNLGKMAPVCGFYTFGEIMRHQRDVETLNCSLVVAGMREGPERVASAVLDLPDEQDFRGHMSVLQHLVRLLETTTSDLEEANAQLHLLAIHDRLTRLLNRGEIERRLNEEVARVDRGEEVASVIMLDIDDFKKVNDTYGHAVGDDVLVAVSNALLESIRAYDVAGRWGGEEFLVILYGIGKRSAQTCAERILEVVRQRPLGCVGHVTASLGVTEIVIGESATDVYRRVDDALYDAKRHGKNRIVMR